MGVLERSWVEVGEPYSTALGWGVNDVFEEECICYSDGFGKQVLEVRGIYNLKFGRACICYREAGAGGQGVL